MRYLTLAEIQALSLDIVKEIDLFCRANDIKYSLAYGSMIGAVRHQGFIPWDDDIDILMTRDNYDRFAKTFKSSNCRFFDRGNTEEYYLNFGRVCDMTRTGSASNMPWIGGDVNPGLWIDIFPLEPVSDNVDEFNTLFDIEHHLQNYNSRMRYASAKPVPGMTLKNRIRMWLYQSLHSRAKHSPSDIVLYMQEAISLKTWAPKNHVAQLGADTPRTDRHPVSDVLEYIDVPFEDTSLPVFKEYDAILRRQYGDYMTLPPVEKRKPRINKNNSFYWK